MPTADRHGPQPASTIQLEGIDVWLTFLPEVTPALHAPYRALLDAGERQRFERYRVDGAREEFLVGKALVRATLSRYRPVAPDAWRFTANRHGRPDIAGGDDDGLTFNLSHTRGLAALAVARHCDLGVDVETVGRDSAVRDLAGRYFSPAEATYVRAADGPDLRERFFAFWTLKEAYIKARGMGLALPLDGFSFDLEGETPTIGFAPSCPDDPARWTFLRRRVSAEHRLALAVSPRDRLPPIRFLRTVPLTDLIEELEPVVMPLDAMAMSNADAGGPAS
ncbi:4'-phosphopantetheinyl transferase superfamily protein [Aurantimonas sp. C2-6-R+9]|uniref:4'-phosphopantetheinyl transferase family protein n=1 Tax=unclassified Aurantimonas TaxID=2638230 RepID=UPI002E17F4F9|nr:MULTISPECIES: 4'-phosphopantetheinyl transferase superfamily protein [unclassified Aurantimonas]MEC5291419.1 4'-phosphopantetheinyl transferase superfamily protein [Aurantimonas sp. C2-3-R2]MEC5381125.1 4'-phosphopantetheinyl transferase superfamily protein [Aurantimonas sp. C2-6-R+9]MEC5412465.1 4'-phosphopantetheinyl transferase superfamily protein [Aurantimonas sp. C2-4-R8]